MTYQEQNDDKQISYLSINHLAAGQDTMMCIKNFNHFLAEICFAYNIKHGEFGDKYRRNISDHDDLSNSIDNFYSLIVYKQDYFLNS